MRWTARRGLTGLGCAVGIGLLGACSAGSTPGDMGRGRRSSLGAQTASTARSGAGTTCELMLPGQPLLAGSFDRLSTTAADFNGDGIADVPVTQGYGSAVGILLGNGDGTWTPSPSPVAVSSPQLVVPADLDGNGTADVLAITLNGYTALLGRGDGTLQAVASSVVEIDPSGVRVADFNGDGAVDFVVPDYTRSKLLLFPGGGDGTFGAPSVAYQSSVAFDQFGATDLDADGHVNLVVLGADLTTILGHGDGTFSVKQVTSFGLGGLGLDTGDINGDGYPDVVLTEYLQAFLGNGDGTVRALPRPPGLSPDTIVLRDLDADGKLDALGTINLFEATYARAIPEIGVWFGHGDGTFGEQELFSIGESPSTPVVGDFDGDGIPDLASTTYQSSVTTLLGKAGRRWDAAEAFTTKAASDSIAVADVNGDGSLDLVTAASWCNSRRCPSNKPVLRVLLGSGTGKFSSPRGSLAVGAYQRAIAVADLDGDGHLDVAAAGAGGIVAMPGDGAGTFGLATMQVTLAPFVSIAAADLDGDGVQDLVAADGVSVAKVFRGLGGGTFDAGTALTGMKTPSALAVGDVDGDGRLDLEIATATGVALLRGSGGGTFAAPTFFFGGPLDALVLGDLNGDGVLDAVAANANKTQVSVLLGLGGGKYAGAVNYALPSTPRSITLVDIDGDGHLEIVAVSPRDSAHLLRGHGDGTFAAAVAYGAGWAPVATVAGDFNADGRLDLAAVDNGSDSVSILINRGCKR